MNEAITVELHFFLTSILWGAIILLVYDILRILRRLIPHNSFFQAFEDLIFWVLASVFIFAMIYTMNNGTIRGFSVIGMGIGMTLYHYVLSEYIVLWTTKLLRLLFKPITFFIGLIKTTLKKLAFKCNKAAKKFLTRLKKHIKSVKIALATKRSCRAAKRSTKRNKPV
ncbi:MAG TPA: spore cortex biosynthesis protein YabQ [Mobilitalea sp.]|nr:spore cortex biosynthesis protein YabQ [Mobilitalea sp.]